MRKILFFLVKIILPVIGGYFFFKYFIKPLGHVNHTPVSKYECLPIILLFLVLFNVVFSCFFKGISNDSGFVGGDMVYAG